MERVIRHHLSDSQIAALTEIPDSQEADIRMSVEIAASTYVDPARFEAEKQAIFFREPMMLGPSDYLPKANTFLQQDILGTPILATRDKDGVVRAFMNVCQHRGTILCPEDGVQEGARIVCPYHAWTYMLDGRLAGVPREEVFGDLTKSKFDLVE